MMYIRKCSNPD